LLTGILCVWCSFFGIFCWQAFCVLLVYKGAADTGGNYFSIKSYDLCPFEMAMKQNFRIQDFCTCIMCSLVGTTKLPDAIVC
jgi:hypothetical protein